MGSMAMVPSWLYDLFGVLMGAIAAYSLALLALGAGSRRTSGWDVELSHAVMGISMCGIFVGRWAFGPSGMWEGLFAALLVWFVIRAGRSVLTFGLHLPHTAIHALMSLAMLLMYWFPTAMGRPSQSRADPGLVLVVAVLVLMSGIFTLASNRRGAVIFGTHVMMRGAGSAAVVTATSDAYLRGTTATAPGIEGAVSRPWLLDATHVVMCVAMAFMLILML